MKRLTRILLLIALGLSAGATADTLPSSETVRSLVMNNWADLIAINYSRQLYKADPHLFGPYLAGLHGAVDWPVNQIDGATALFHAQIVGGGADKGPEQPARLCESSGEVQGDDAPADPGLRYSYPSSMCFDDGGVLNVEYLRETERGLPIQIEKAYAMVPSQHFLVVRYTMINNVPAERQKSVHVRFAEVVDLNNKAALDHEEAADRLVDTGLNQPKPGQPVSFMRAQWHPELNAWIANMRGSNGAVLIFGAFQDMDRHRVFKPLSDQLEFDRAIAPEMDAFDQTELAANMEDQTDQDIGLALWKEGDIAPGSSQQYYFFYALASSFEEAQQIANEARTPGNAEAWFQQTQAAYQSWLQQGWQGTTADPALGKALTRTLITDKQAQQPQFGSFVASTNPAYGFKVWPRDSSVTALGLTASGHLDEAVRFYRWMASVQEDGSNPQYPVGTWYSNYSYWIHKQPKAFVEPEWDSLGLFIIGVYHTWRALNALDAQAALRFLTDSLDGVAGSPGSIYEAVGRSADYIHGNINESGFGPADHSIWEEDLAWNMFTQVTYASGLNAARLLAEAMGETDRANAWRDGGNRVLAAIHKPDSVQPCPGLWNEGESRWNRAVKTDCTRDDRLDSSTNLAWVFGLVHADDARAASQRNVVLSRLTPGNDDIGIARYEGDEFYRNNPASPGGTGEASDSMPSWPQLDSYMSMLEHWQSLDDAALARLQWYARSTAVGFTPPGEAVDWPTDRPLPSTSAEPVTGAWYAIGLLNYLNVFDPRLPPLEQ